MYDGGGVPSCIDDAYRFLNMDRAWVACVACEGCEHSDGPHVHTVASSATREQVATNPECRQYTDARCPPSERASFLIGGVKSLMDGHLAEA
jgi:hypothetical protein